jgi:small subunit ribosomal protein S14
MKLKYLLRKDKAFRAITLKIDLLRLQYKAVFHNCNLLINERVLAFRLLTKLLKNRSTTRYKTRCIITNRSRSNYRRFKLSRLQFRRMAS